MYFSVNLCSVEDSVENYQAYMISYSAVMVFESYGILFFVSISLRISMLNYAFTHILFPLCILLLDVEMYRIGRLFDQDFQCFAKLLYFLFKLSKYETYKVVFRI